MTNWWSSARVVLVAVSVAGLVGCSSGGASTEPTASPSTAVTPATQPATAAAVATGLRNIDQIAKQIAASAGTDKAKAASLDGQIEPTWSTIEDVVKQNDPNTYLAMEDSFAVLEKAAGDGDAAAAEKGSTAVSSAVQAYLAKYPG